MAHRGGQIGHRAVHIHVGLAGEGKVKPGEPQNTERTGAAEGLYAPRLHPEEGKFLIYAVVGIPGGGQNGLPVCGADAVRVPRHRPGGSGQLLCKVQRHPFQRLRRHRLGGDAALFLKAVGVVGRPPQQAESCIDRQSDAPGGQYKVRQRRPAAWACRQPPQRAGQPEHRRPDARQQQHLPHRAVEKVAQPGDTAHYREDHSAAQPIHGGAAGTRRQVGGEEQRQRHQPPKQRTAPGQIRPHSGRGRPVKLMTQRACTMTLPVSSVTSPEQNTILPPILSTFPTAVRVLPAAAAAR